MRSASRRHGGCLTGRSASASRGAIRTRASEVTSVVRPGRTHPPITSARLLALVAVVALAAGAAVPQTGAAPGRSPAQPAKSPIADGDPIAGAFVYPVGDDLDYSKARAGEGAGFYVSDPYLARRGRRKQRVHYGVDLANGRGGA